MKFENIIESIFGYNWKQFDSDGVYGVVCVLAYLEGCRPDIKNLSEYLEIDSDQIRRPFYRLLSAGVFSKNFNARGDLVLKGKTKDDSMFLCAWGIIYGIATEQIYRNYN